MAKFDLILKNLPKFHIKLESLSKFHIESKYLLKNQSNEKVAPYQADHKCLLSIINGINRMKKTSAKSFLC